MVDAADGDADDPDELSETDELRVVVYMSGVGQDKQHWLVDSVAKAAYSNLTGQINTKVQQTIDGYLTSNGLTDVPIMLVGYSNGGQQMQIYATTGQYKANVTDVVTFASPQIKKASEYPSATHILNIQGSNDWVATTFGHADAADSYTNPLHLSTLDNIQLNADIWLGSINIFGNRPFAKAAQHALAIRSQEQALRSVRALYVVPGNKNLPPAPWTDRHDPNTYVAYAQKFDDTARDPNSMYGTLRDDVSAYAGGVVTSSGNISMT